MCLCVCVCVSVCVCVCVCVCVTYYVHGIIVIYIINSYTDFTEEFKCNI